MLDKLLTLFINVNDVKIQVIIELSNKIINKLVDRFKDIANNTKYKTVSSRKHPGRQKEWNHNTYDKEFKNGLSSAIKDINNGIIKWVCDDKNIMVVEIKSQTAQIEKIILYINKSIADLIFNNSKIKFVLNKKSAISKVKKINNENIKEFMQFYDRDIEEFNKLMNEVESMESLDQKIDKISSLNTSLLKTVKKTIDSSLSNYDKQVAIETGLIDYELDYFNKHIDTPPLPSVPYG